MFLYIIVETDEEVDEEQMRERHLNEANEHALISSAEYVFTDLIKRHHCYLTEVKLAGCGYLAYPNYLD